MSNFTRGLLTAGAFALVLCTIGCGGFRASVDTIDVDRDSHYDQNFDYSDLRKISQEMTEGVLASQVLKDEVEAPIVLFGGIQNKTSDYLNTKSLSDRMRTALFKSGKLRFVNEGRRPELFAEQDYQAAHTTAETRVRSGGQFGAKYVITGTLSSMRSQSPDQVRASRKTTSYYLLTMEITNLETGLLAWTDDAEFAREANVPMVRW